MDLVEQMSGASIIVDECANVNPGERVVIVGDWRSLKVTERLAAAVESSGGDATVTVMTTGGDDGNEPPEAVAGAMLEADVVLLVASRGIGHTRAVERALENGARAVAMATLTLDQLSAEGLQADFKSLAPTVQRIADRFTSAESARITAENGTEVAFDLSGRDGNALTCIAEEPGDFTVAYCAEANVTPTGCEGRIVFDGSVPNLDIGLLEEEIVMECVDGSVTAIEGGSEAREIRRVLSEYDDSSVHEVAELAIGMNPECLEFTGGFIHDHGVFGTIHVGFGTSSSLGGETRTPLHFDCTLDSGTLYLDGEPVVADREFLE